MPGAPKIKPGEFPWFYFGFVDEETHLKIRFKKPT
jgi:hypothetical protein